MVQPDPSIPYKDAAFALLSHEPPLASNEATKASLIAALTQWVQTDFEDRIDNSSQQFGVEQIMRFIGAASVKTLPSSINESVHQGRHAPARSSPTSETTTRSVAPVTRS